MVQADRVMTWIQVCDAKIGKVSGEPVLDGAW